MFELVLAADPIFNEDKRGFTPFHKMGTKDHFRPRLT
jgi:hypothetical protein